MPNDVPDWTTKNAVQIVGQDPARTPLGDTSAAVQAADQGQETITTSGSPTSSTAAIASFKAAAGQTPALVKAGAMAEGTTTAVNPAFGQATVAGHLLVAVVSAYNVAPTTGAAGWSMVVDSNPAGSGNHETIWVKPNCGNGETAPGFTSAGSVANMQAALFEFSGVATASPTDKSGGIFQPSSAASITVTATAIDAQAADLVILVAHWRSGTAPFTATFSETLNNGAAAVRLADNGSSNLSDHTVAAYGIIPAIVTVQPLGVAPWPYDANGNSAPAAGTVASVVLAAVAGKTYYCHTLLGSQANGGTAGKPTVQLVDGAAVVLSAVTATAAANAADSRNLIGLAHKGTAGNSMTGQFSSGVASMLETIYIGAYLR